MAQPEMLSQKLEGKETSKTVREYLPLVERIAGRYSRFRPDMLDDLVQVGCIGLLKAIKYYDPSRARLASFKTLASCYIKGEIRHFLRDHGSLVQVPRRFTEISTQLSQVEESLHKELQRAPSVHELSQRSGHSVKDICEVLQSLDACTHYESLEAGDDRDDSEDNRALGEMVADRKHQDFVLASEDRELITQAVKQLGERTSKIVEFVFFYDLTQKETAQKLGLSEMVVSRAMRNGLSKLKEILSTEIL